MLFALVKPVCCTMPQSPREGQRPIRLCAGSVAFTCAVTRWNRVCTLTVSFTQLGGELLPDEWQLVQPSVPNRLIIVVIVMPLAVTVMTLLAVLLGPGGKPLLTLSWTV